MKPGSKTLEKKGEAADVYYSRLFRLPYHKLFLVKGLQVIFQTHNPPSILPVILPSDWFEPDFPLTSQRAEVVGWRTPPVRAEPFSFF